MPTIDAKEAEVDQFCEDIRPGADCGSYHELIIAKFRLKLKKLGKTTGHSGMTKIKSLMIIQWK